MNCIHNKDEQEHCEECNCDKPQHTATPWKSYNHYVLSSVGDIANCQIVQEGNPITPEESYANAEFIVKACNNHDALMEALKDCLAVLRLDSDMEEDFAEEIKKAKTALAQVEKG